ncbi:type IV secretory system conjugative DNA transfer family protein [Clostridium perfringens]|uniref:VirD4-like conjugal transfer protein, CD1115 family n=1 Tax=Clostridium perfringens TaxID=1502 RepID=UPI002093B490|nr:type IV secretory system conjugative DNA transfer family protein [Clostridium perfringens]MCO6003216.1 type IV secretory system conjugative DNA transfer family protein [Clostridium perfringens]MCO7395961.1 type IV secretory system conjugative DNA transfer family protein [Clostridium perfringens]MCP8916936.1 type IV secretory system conjugative DNA transfer family protein [Clostridium perfringens]MCP8966787.1 type IV secretory system conjugative DNA transfer family protein [Clostridium perfri
MGFFSNLKNTISNELRSNEKYKNEKFNLGRFVSSNKTLVTLTLSILLAGTIIVNIIVGAFTTLTSFNLDTISSFSVLKSMFNITLIFKYPLFYLLIYIVLFVPISKLIFDLKKSFISLEDGQKGTSRFTTLEEIKAQYKEVPEKKEGFKGGGGVPISRHKDKIYIDTSPVNNLIIGTTRSGKGEMFVVPLIDIYSRAEEQASMVLNDPKGELVAMSKDTLEKRGYRVEVLNLLNPLNSISYNPLQLIIDAYEKGELDEAQNLCKTLTYALYYNPSAKDPFWQNSAMTLVNGLILAIIDECLNKCKILDVKIKDFENKINELRNKINEVENTEEIKIINNKIEAHKEAIKELEKRKKEENSKITLYTVANMLSELGGDTDDDGNKLDNYFQSLPANSVAKMQYATSKFADGSARGSIFAVAMAELSRFTMSSIAKMTAKNSINLKEVGFSRYIEKVVKVEVKEKLEDDKKINFIKTNISECIGAFSGLEKVEIMKGYEPNEDRFIEEIRAFGSKGNEIIKGIEVDTSDLDVNELGEYIIKFRVLDTDYDNKPIALFMVTPDYDGSNNVLASIFIRQLYYVLSKEASLFDTARCEREVIFILDEFGNMPPIEGMGTLTTVCLGRRIRFNMIIQAYSQLKKLYGEDEKTIVGNCGNVIYILTNDNDTAEEISKSLGDKTIVTQSRSGEILDITKNRTESVDSRRLLLPEELKKFKEGETVVLRVIKRQDLKRSKIVPNPIYNHGETSFKYRYEYLSEDFNNENVFKNIKIKSKHRNLDLDSLLIDFNESKDEYISKIDKQLNNIISAYDRNLNVNEDINTIKEDCIESFEEKANETEVYCSEKDITLGGFLDYSFIMKLNTYNNRFRELRDIKFNKDTPFSEFEKLYNFEGSKHLEEYNKILNILKAKKVTGGEEK